MRTFGILLLFIMVLFASCFTANAVEINNNFDSKEIENVFYSFTPTSLADARQSNIQNWHSLNNKPLNLGLETRPVWIQFTLNNHLDESTQAVLSLDNPLRNNIYLYHFNNQKQLKPKPLNNAQLLPDGSIKSKSLLVKLMLPANSETKVYLKVNNAGVGLRPPIILWQQDALLAHKSLVNLLYGLLIGFIFSLAVSSLVLFVFSRKHYFAYAGTITFMLSLFLAYLGGFGFHYAPSSIAALQQLIIPILLMLITILFLPLQLQVCSPTKSNLAKGQKVITTLYVLLMVFIWLFPSVVVFAILTIPIVLIYYMVTTLLYLRRHATSSNKSLLMALGLFLIVVIHFAIALTGLYTVTRASLIFTFAASLGCSFCLSYTVIRLFILQRDQQVITQQALIAKSAAQDALLNERIELQEHARQELESQVDERTFELQVTLRELEDKNRELEQLNMEDALTGVKNRRFFDKKLLMETRRSRREQTPLSIVMLDIDKFKLINDSYGHLTGDQVIRAVCDIIKQQLKRPLDEVARYGGEEFVILLPNTNNQGALKIAEQIRQAISNNVVSVAGTAIEFTVSAGVYTHTVNGVHNPELFTECADKALYLAKQHGRNQVVNFSSPQ